MSGDKQKDGQKEQWIKNIGEYRYYSLILADFNPVAAALIFDLPAHEIAEAFVSRMCHEYRPERKR